MCTNRVFSVYFYGPGVNRPPPSPKSSSYCLLGQTRNRLNLPHRTENDGEPVRALTDVSLPFVTVSFFFRPENNMMSNNICLCDDEPENLLLPFISFTKEVRVGRMFVTLVLSLVFDNAKPVCELVDYCQRTNNSGLNEKNKMK